MVLPINRACPVDWSLAKPFWWASRYRSGINIGSGWPMTSSSLYPKIVVAA